MFLPDIHGEEVDRAAFACAVAFVKAYDPHDIILLGDVLDFPTVSKFPRDPVGGQKLQAELDFTRTLLVKVREAAPKADIAYLRGNHEYRLTRYLWTRAAELWPLRNLRVPELLDLKSTGIRYIEDGRMPYHGLTITHGNRVSQRAGYTAHREMESHWTSGVSGHTHRLAKVSRTTVAGRYIWIEAGCLCGLKPEYMEGQTPDWQHGLAWGEFRRGGERYRVQAEEIIKGRILSGGNLITGG